MRPKGFWDRKKSASPTVENYFAIHIRSGFGADTHPLCAGIERLLDIEGLQRGCRPVSLWLRGLRARTSYPFSATLHGWLVRVLSITLRKFQQMAVGCRHGQALALWEGADCVCLLKFPARLLCLLCSMVRRVWVDASAAAHLVSLGLGDFGARAAAKMEARYRAGAWVRAIGSEFRALSVTGLKTTAVSPLRSVRCASHSCSTASP